MDDNGFDELVEVLCKPFYDNGIGRPSLPPTIYFRLLLIGPSCGGGCTLWIGGLTCISPGGSHCYYGMQELLCVCDLINGCYLLSIGPC